MLVLTDLKYNFYEPKVQLPNNSTMNVIKTGSIPLSGSLINHAKKSHGFMDYTVTHTYP